MQPSMKNDSLTCEKADAVSEFRARYVRVASYADSILRSFPAQMRRLRFPARNHDFARVQCEGARLLKVRKQVAPDCMLARLLIDIDSCSKTPK